MRSTLRTIEPNVVVYEARTLSDIAAESAAIARLAMRLLTGFAIVALVARRDRHLRRDVVQRPAADARARHAHRARRQPRRHRAAGPAPGGRHRALGLTSGLVGGVVAARSLSTLLFGVPPWDPVTVAAGVAVLAATTLLASAIPARRASRVDPARTLMIE